MRLNFKILFGLTSILAIWAATLGQSYRTMKQLESEYSRAVGETLPIILSLEELRFATLRIVLSTSENAMIMALQRNPALASDGDEALVPDAHEIHETATGVADFGRTFKTYSSQIDLYEAGNSDIRDSIGRLGSKLVAISRRIETGLDAGLPSVEILELKEMMEETEADILSLMVEQITQERQALRQRQGNLRQGIDDAISNLIVSAILAVIGITALIVLSAVRIIKPIERLTAAAVRIANGELAPLPRVTQQDEIGTLSNAFSDMSSHLQDMIRRHEAATEKALASEQRFRDVAEASSDWIWEIGPDYCITFMSDRFYDVTGLPAAAVLGQPISDFLTPDQRGTCDGFEGLNLDGVKALRDMRCHYSDVSDQARICRLSGKPLFDKTGVFMGYRGTARDITSEVEAQNIAEHLALHDALTGLPNRIFMAERLDQNLAKIQRHGGAVSVICLDLDHFKEVNDTLGHAAGDALLKCVTKRLESTLRVTDTLARLGGDEFVIVQSDAIQPGGAEVLCRRILQVISEPFEVEGQSLYIGASLGVSLAPIDSLDPEQLLKNADVAMYRAKKDGRNNFRFFEAGMDAELQERKAMERDLRLAIQKNELEMYYQPLIGTQGQQIQGVEALVRWNRPGFGMVPPGDFIPLAEESGLIIPLGEWILRTSCLQAAEWPDLFVAVNLSPTQFKQQDLIGSVKQVLDDTGLAPDRLELEITEGVLLEQTAYSLMTLRGLQDLGVRIAMDDFGTGYSSLSYLQMFAFDKIKLDQSFVQELGKSSGATSIVRTVLDLGRSLGMVTTAEGVETADQRDYLTQQGCNQMQGYYFSKPVPAAEINALLESSLSDRATKLAAVSL
ncbi:EAL domain-containing protein [Loktanella salsilacus]|uniref:EAL domain-containing protein n=1 Tax=Loktanella salsilacus TaxID=195913 RepID=UPI003736FBAC